MSKWWATFPVQNMSRASSARTVRAMISCSIFRAEFWAWFLAPRFASFWSLHACSIVCKQVLTILSNSCNSCHFFAELTNYARLHFAFCCSIHPVPFRSSLSCHVVSCGFFYDLVLVCIISHCLVSFCFVVLCRVEPCRVRSCISFCFMCVFGVALFGCDS